MMEQSDEGETKLEFSRILVSNLEAVSPKISAQSRTNNANFLHAIDGMSAAAIAEMMGVHESTISRLKTSGTLAMVCLVMACAGLKLVPKDAVVFLQPEQFK